MKIKKRKLAIASIALTSAMLVASVSLTIAWYNGSGDMSLNNIKITLRDRQLDISDDNIEWKDKLDEDDLDEVKYFHPVSSMFSDTWLNQKKTRPVFKEGYSSPYKTTYCQESDNADAVEGFFSQMLYLRCDTDSEVTVDSEKTAINQDEITENLNREVAHKFYLEGRYGALSEEQILEKINDVVSSLRISILVLDEVTNEGESSEEEYLTATNDDYQYAIINPNKKSDTYLGGVLDSNLDGYYDSYDNKEVLFGEVDNVSEETLVYDEPITTEDTSSFSPYASWSVFEATTKQGVRPLNLEESAKAGLTIKKENSLSLNEVESEFSFQLRAHVAKRIVISWYVEGWDLACTNLTMYANFHLNLAFKLSK